MKKYYFVSLLILGFMVFCFELASAASNLEEGVKQLAEQISKSMQEKQSKKIAIIDFSDLNGNVTTLGQFMAEELTTQLFMIAPGKFEVIERRQLLKLVDELSLGQLGLIDEKSIKEMGRVLGVDAIVTGSLTDLGNTVKVNARMIAVESAKVVAVAASEIQQTGVVTDLMGKQTEGRQVGIQTKTQKDMPSSRQKVEVQDFLFDLQQCKASSKGVVCNLLITNKDEKDMELHIFGNNGSTSRSRMIDDLGNEYSAKTAKLGNNEHGQFAENLLSSGVPTTSVLFFEDVSQKASKVAVLIIYCKNAKTGKYFSAKFHNIPLTK